MDYTVSLAPNGNEVITWDVPAPACGDFAECHADPPTCECPRPGKCEAVHSVSDADFGYWHESWGDPPVHEFPCDEPATVTVRDPYDGQPVRLCAKHGADQ